MAEKTDEQYVDTIRAALAHLKLRIKEAQDVGLVVRVSAESSYSTLVDLARATIHVHREY